MPRVFHGRWRRPGGNVHGAEVAAGELGWSRTPAPRSAPVPAARAEGASMTEQQELPRRHAFTCDAQVLDRPVRVVFGAGTLAQVAPEARALGRRVLMVAGRHEDEAADRVHTALGGELVG